MCYEEVAGFQESTHQVQRWQGHCLDKGDDLVEFGRGASPLRSLSFMSEIIVDEQYQVYIYVPMCSHFQLSCAERSHGHSQCERLGGHVRSPTLL